jgi:hypothetical protein
MKTAVLTTFVAAAGSARINFSADSGVADTSISFDGVTGGLRTDRAITIGDDNTCTKIDGSSECVGAAVTSVAAKVDALASALGMCYANNTGTYGKCGVAGTLDGSSTVKCSSGHYTNVGGCTGSKGCNANYAFNDAACGNNRAAIQGDCFIGMAAMSQSGPDESYAAYGPDEGGPKITWRSKLRCRCCVLF